MFKLLVILSINDGIVFVFIRKFSKYFFRFEVKLFSIIVPKIFMIGIISSNIGSEFFEFSDGLCYLTISEVRDIFFKG